MYTRTKDEVFSDIEGATRLLPVAIINKFNEYSRMYRFTNENLEEQLKYLNLKDKSVLTVCGSADQYLSFLLAGASSLTVFDINKITRYLLALKRAALLALDLEEFKKYFKKPPGMLNGRLYSKVEKFLEDDTRLFWDSLYSINESRGLNYLFFADEASAHIPYLTRHTYNKLKGILESTPKPDFISCDALELPSFLDGERYDYIYLSNIRAYSVDIIRWIEFIIRDLSAILNEGGEIMADYYWGEHSNKLDYLYYGFEERALCEVNNTNYTYTYKKGGNKY